MWTEHVVVFLLSFYNSTWCQEWDLVNLRTFAKSSQAAVKVLRLSVKTKTLTKKKATLTQGKYVRQRARRSSRRGCGRRTTTASGATRNTPICPSQIFRYLLRTNFHSSRTSGRNGFKYSKDFTRQPVLTNKVTRTKLTR